MPLFACLLDSEKLPTHKKQFDILSPVSGKVEKLDATNELSFKHRMFGEGALVAPTGFYVKAPFDCIIENSTTTANRIRIKDKNGLRLQIQCGFGSHKLYGNGYKSAVKTGQKVSKGDVLVQFDLTKLKRLLDDTRFAITLLNSDKTKGLILNEKKVTAAEDVLFSVIV